MSLKPKIPPFNYLSGSDFTENLKHLTKSKTILEMAERFDVKKTTFSTWNTHNRTSHELMVRLHLALGIPIEDLALSEEERAKLPNRPRKFISHSEKDTPVIEAAVSQHSTVILKSYCLSNGKLLPTGDMPYAKRIFNGWDLNELATIEVETNQARYLVDQSQNDAVSGEYLIDMNGRMSINHIQRLPNKLAVVFGTSTVEVADEDIKSIRSSGRCIGEDVMGVNKKTLGFQANQMALLHSDYRVNTYWASIRLQSLDRRFCSNFS